MSLNVHHNGCKRTSCLIYLSIPILSTKLQSLFLFIKNSLQKKQCILPKKSLIQISLYHVSIFRVKDG